MNHEKLISALHGCMETCSCCFDECLREEDVTMAAECIRLDRECADMCTYLEQAIARTSPFVKELTDVCAVMCEACGKECEKHDHDHCQECAKACRPAAS